MRSRRSFLLYLVCAVFAYAAAASAASAASKARFVHRPAAPTVNAVVTFEATKSVCERKPCAYRWRTATRHDRLRRVRPVGRGKVLRRAFGRAGVWWVRLTVSERGGRRTSTTRRVTVSQARPEVSPQTPPPAPSDPGAPTPTVSLEPVDGVPSWYGRFAHPLPTEASHFPIGVWFESVTAQADIDKDKAVGLNTYVVLTGSSDLSLLASNGMKVLAQHGEWTSRADGPGSGAIAGWELRDEVDMELGPDEGYEEVQRILSGLPADGRLRYNNYGKGVTFWQSDEDAARFVNAQDVVSADNYWFTDNNICSMTEGGALLNGRTRDLSDAECHRAANYGATVRRLRDLMSPRGSKPVWAFVEVGHPFTEDHWPSIEPQQVQAAVWQSLIAGARGIIYFNHSFGGPEQTQHALREPEYADVRAAVAETNRRIKTLAPVLNAPTVTSGWSQGAGTTAMVKWAAGHFYVFAGSAGLPAIGRFSLPCVGDATASVLDEGRSVAVRGGVFEDAFADGNSVHVYRLDGGGTCGLLADRGAAVPGSTPVRREAGVSRISRVPRRFSARASRLVVPVRCASRCTVRSRLTATGGGRVKPLAVFRRTFAPGHHRVILRLSRGDRRRIAARRTVRLRTELVDLRGTIRRIQRLVARR